MVPSEVKMRFLAPSAGIAEVAKRYGTPCHGVQVVNPLRLTVLASKSGDYTTAVQKLCAY